jgi:two-component system OmpR family sensor kinase
MTMVRADASIESEIEIVDADALVRLVVSGFTSVAEAKDVSVSIVPGPNAELTVRTADLRLIVSNLLDNAVRYTRAGGSVKIGATHRDGRFVIEVVDSGCGIPDSAMPYLYDRFFRAAPMDIDGTGLGLAIARTAADRNGFDLEIVNRTDAQGVRAAVTIPLAHVAPAALPSRAA